MIGMDTNLLLRYLKADDTIQTPLAVEVSTSRSPEQRGYISLVALAEVAWTLRRTGRVSANELRGYLRQLADLDHVVFQSEAAVYEAIENFVRYGMDFPDCLIERTGHFDGCEVTMTFDRKASRCHGFRLVTHESVAALRTVRETA